VIIRSTAIIAKNCTIFRQQSPQIALLAWLGSFGLGSSRYPDEDTHRYCRTRTRPRHLGPSGEFDALLADRPDLRRGAVTEQTDGGTPKVHRAVPRGIRVECSGYVAPTHLVTKDNIGSNGGPNNVYDPDNGYRDVYKKIWGSNNLIRMSSVTGYSRHAHSGGFLRWRAKRQLGSAN
jgi:hypothetical protein